MTQKFVRYGPDVDHIEPDFDQGATRMQAQTQDRAEQKKER
jgi:hypothetical protein